MLQNNIIPGISSSTSIRETLVKIITIFSFFLHESINCVQTVANKMKTKMKKSQKCQNAAF